MGVHTQTKQIEMINIEKDTQILLERQVCFLVRLFVFFCY